MKIKRIKTLAIEVFNELNPNFMKTIFTSKANSTVQPFDFLVKNSQYWKYCSKSLMVLGPKKWNALPENVEKRNILHQIEGIC